MTFDVEQTARRFKRWWDNERAVKVWQSGQTLSEDAVEPCFCSWADAMGLTAEEQRAVRRESELLEAEATG